MNLDLFERAAADRALEKLPRRSTGFLLLASVMPVWSGSQDRYFHTGDLPRDGKKRVWREEIAAARELLGTRTYVPREDAAVDAVVKAVVTYAAVTRDVRAFLQRAEQLGKVQIYVPGKTVWVSSEEAPMFQDGEVIGRRSVEGSQYVSIAEMPLDAYSLGRSLQRMKSDGSLTPVPDFRGSQEHEVLLPRKFFNNYLDGLVQAASAPPKEMFPQGSIYFEGPHGKARARGEGNTFEFLTVQLHEIESLAIKHVGTLLHADDETSAAVVEAGRKHGVRISIDDYLGEPVPHQESPAGRQTKYDYSRY